MKRSGPPKRKKPLRGKMLPTVAKRVPERYRQYSADRISYLKANRRCLGQQLVPIDGECKTWATDVHHKRGRTGEDLLDQDHWVALCRPCHTWVEANPAAARALGLKEHRNQAR